MKAQNEKCGFFSVPNCDRCCDFSSVWSCRFCCRSSKISASHKLLHKISIYFQFYAKIGGKYQICIKIYFILFWFGFLFWFCDFLRARCLSSIFGRLILFWYMSHVFENYDCCSGGLDQSHCDWLDICYFMIIVCHILKH